VLAGADRAGQHPLDSFSTPSSSSGRASRVGSVSARPIRWAALGLQPRSWRCRALADFRIRLSAAASASLTGTATGRMPRAIGEAMSNTYHATLMIWPVTPVSGGVAERLAAHGVDLTALRSSRQVSAAWRTDSGELGITVNLTRLPRARLDLTALLGSLRRDGVSYYAWAYDEHDRVAAGYAHSREQPVDRTFAILASGEPLIRASEVEALAAENATLDVFRGALEARLAQGRPHIASDVPLARVQITVEAG
jgi:hypothetical protein